MTESSSSVKAESELLVLTHRQRQVVRLLALGLTAEEIGTRLGISTRTARAHRDVLRQKLGVAHQRQIPAAVRERLGIDPLTLTD